jgi:hypothetical protein
MSSVRIILPQDDGNYVFDGQKWILEGVPSEVIEDRAKITELWTKVVQPAGHFVALRPVKPGDDDYDSLG